MDRGGRIAQPLNRRNSPAADTGLSRFLSRVRAWRRLARWGAAAFVGTAIGYGMIAGDHIEEATDLLRQTRDQMAQTLGFGLREISVSGNRHLTPDEILAAMGVDGTQSLLFVDAAQAREKLLALPWVEAATIQKLYPDRLNIAVTEREVFALWQRAGKVQMIARDGTVIAPLTDRRFATLPLVVGEGAQTHASEFLAVLGDVPQLQERVRAAIFVGGRRWNLRLKNGMDIRLPEGDARQALSTVMKLHQTQNLLERDIAFVDLRLPDVVSVRVSESYARERDDALRLKKKRAGDA